jgi:hypothetical protein
MAHRTGAALTVDPDPIERRLAAIVSPDTVGDSRLVAEDETVRAAER